MEFTFRYLEVRTIHSAADIDHQTVRSWSALK